MNKTLLDTNMQNLQNMITLGGLFGEYSIALHLSLIVVCLQAVLIGLVCGLLIFTALGMPFFWGRAFWRACTWNAAAA